MDEQAKQYLARYREGDIEALGQLVELYRRPLYGFILRMTEGCGDPDEVFQEVWFRVIKKLHLFKDKNFLGWIFRIAHNLVVDHSRMRKRFTRLKMEDSKEDVIARVIQDPGPGPDTVFGNQDMGLRIRAALEKLPEEQKEVFVMRVDARLPFKEIAKIQGVSINTALARMQYALAKLREELKDEYERVM